MTAVEEVVVVIPANDEEALVGRCLEALDVAIGAFRALDERTRVRVVVVLDACVDGTERIVRRREGIEVVEVGFRNAGAARASGVDVAIAGTSTPLPRVWIANTDADSAVPEHWLLRQLALARSGADVIVGSIRPDRADLSAEQYLAWEHRAQAEHAVGGSSERIHGANLGVRADAYAELGGFAPLAVGEDVDLVTRARSVGMRVVASESCWVTTSARVVGRAPGGYADYVRANY